MIVRVFVLQKRIAAECKLYLSRRRQTHTQQRERLVFRRTKHLSKLLYSDSIAS